ncbi:MAG: Verru_Chthon cassette protein B [Candidatus Methylacidiphilales bacterium]|nr:Verru_Chthon cassette protein B [Candidatus Methylacidiphilales bacterium]
MFYRNDMNLERTMHRHSFTGFVYGLLGNLATFATRRAGERRGARGGFTLVEVSLSIGLLSFSLLALIGLVPSGLGALRDSSDQTTRAQIIQRISNDLVITDFADMAAAAPLYFDEEGQVQKTQTTAHYRVEFRDVPPTLPGLTETEQAGMHAQLKCIRIGITRTEGGVQAATAITHWYSLQVAKR